MRSCIPILILFATVSVYAQQASVLYEWHYGMNGMETPLDADSMPGGGYVLAGSTNSIVSGSWGTRINTAFIQGLSAAGDSAWSIDLSPYIQSNSQINSVKGLDNGRILIGGLHRDTVQAPPNAFMHVPFHAMLDTFGNFIWYHEPFPSRSGTGYYSKEFPDGSFLVAGSSAPIGGGQPSTLYFAKIDSIGNMLWAKDSGMPLGYKYRSLNFSSEEGCNIIVGYNGLPQVVAFDDNGDTLFSKTVQVKPGVQINGVEIWQAEPWMNGYLMSGYYRIGSNYTGLLIYYDKNFNEVRRYEMGNGVGVGITGFWTEDNGEIILTFEDANQVEFRRLDSIFNNLGTVYAPLAGDFKGGFHYTQLNGRSILVGVRNYSGVTQSSDFYYGAFTNLVQSPYVHDYCRPGSTPTADFDATYVGDSIFFTSTSTSGLDCEPGLTYYWDFLAPPGGSAKSANPRIQAYPNLTTFPVQLIVTNEFGCTDTLNKDALVATSTKEQIQKKNTLRLWPNPAQDVLNVSTTQLGTITLYDAQGRAVRQVELQTCEYQLGLEGLASGLYLWRFATNDGRFESGKVVVQF